MANEDLYKLLEVDPEARIEVIEAAYRAISQASRPDKPANKDNLQQRLNEGMQILRDPQKRSQYDRQLNRDNKGRLYSKVLFYEVIDDLRGLRDLGRQGFELADGTKFNESMALEAIDLRFAQFSEEFVIGHPIPVGRMKRLRRLRPDSDKPFNIEILGETSVFLDDGEEDSLVVLDDEEAESLVFRGGGVPRIDDLLDDGYSMPRFSEIWNRIEIYEGEIFHLKGNAKFTYTITGTTLITSRTHYNISRTEFEKAYQLVPFPGPGVINNTVRGPSYVWAILHDSRIKRSDW